MAENENTFAKLWNQGKDYLQLNIENAKLTAAEKATRLITAAAIALMGIFMGAIMMFFFSIALANLLGNAVGTCWSYVIVGGAYLIVFLVIYLLRKPLILNPVARFVTKLFLS